MLLILFLIFIIIPLTILFLLVQLFSKTKTFGKIAGRMCIIIFSGAAFLFLAKFLTTKTKVDQDDIYGEYVIDKAKCAGKQADWQYNHYRFEITKDNKVFFHITENDKIIKTIPGTVEFKTYYRSPHINLKFEDPRFHIIEDNPTLYRENWTFYYVFASSEYGNVIFTKGRWKSDESYF